MVACRLWPLRVAMTIALWLLLTVPEAAVKVALLWPDATVTLAGTASNRYCSRAKPTAALVAALFNVTVQVLTRCCPESKARKQPM